MNQKTLKEISSYRNETVNFNEADIASYISTENMLPNKAGIKLASSLPTSGNVSKFYVNDILVSNIRPYFKKIWRADRNGTCSNDILVFKKINCDSDFLYWLLSSDEFFAYVVATSKGTKMPRGDKQAIMNYPVPCFDSDQQRSIAEILKPFNAKIVLNSQINDYLLQLIEIAFTCKFEKSLTEACPLSDVFSISTEVTKPWDNLGQTWEYYSIPAYDNGSYPVFELADNIKSNKYIVDSDCILVSKLNPSVKRVWHPLCLTSNSVCSTEFIVYRPYHPEYIGFYFAALNSTRFHNYLLAHVSGTTGSRQRSQPAATLNYRIPNPEPDKIKEFCSLANPALNLIHKHETEIMQLQKTRDILLPKLMSGEIDVSKVDITQLNNHLSES